MKQLALIAGLCALAGCGADGEPVQPTASSEITLSPSGVYANSRIGLRKGPITVTLGI